MADLDEAADHAQEALEITENTQRINGWMKGDTGAARRAVANAPGHVGSVLSSLENTLIPRTTHLRESAEKAQEELQRADETERFDDTTDARVLLEEIKTNAEEASAILDECKSYAKTAHDALRELSGRLTTAYQLCDPTDVAIMNARNHIEELIRRLS